VAYVSPDQADACVQAARSAGLDAWVAGSVRKEGDRKAVEIVPLGISYGAQSLQIR